MAVSGVPGSAPPPLDLAAMEERLKRFDAEREATNTWLKTTFPELADLLKPGAAKGVHGKGPKADPELAPLTPEDRYEGVQRNYHLRSDAMQRALEEGCEPKTDGIPPVGRPPSQHKGKSFAQAVEDMHAKNDRSIQELMQAGFAENDLVDYMRDSSAKASAQSFERGYQDREQVYQYERDNERRMIEQTIEEEGQRRRDDLERQQRDDALRKDREDDDRRRREVDDANRRRQELDAASLRRDQERRDQETRDRQRRLEEERIRADRERD